MILKYRGLFLLAGLWATLVWAQHTRSRPLDQIELSATAEQDVGNDLLLGTLYKELTGPQPGDIAAQVNESIDWALTQTKAVKGVRVFVTDYRTYPIYATGTSTVTAWRIRQTIRLESQDAKVLGRLVAKLQTRLAVDAIGFGLTPGIRDSTESVLTDKALIRFQQRALQIAKAFGRSNYQIIHLNLSTIDNSLSPVAFRGARAMTENTLAPAQLEAGTQTMTVTASGTIQLEGKP